MTSRPSSSVSLKNVIIKSRKVKRTSLQGLKVQKEPFSEKVITKNADLSVAYLETEYVGFFFTSSFYEMHVLT